MFPALFLYLYIGFLSIYVHGSLTFLLDFVWWWLFWSVEIAKLARRARTQITHRFPADVTQIRSAGGRRDTAAFDKITNREDI